ncbi:MAG: FAD-dependent oxidoreductase [Desulfobaccales bacterium]
MTERKKVLVVGGGIAGLTSAWELANLGMDVLLVDQRPFLGGHAGRLACKATDRCLKCNNCLVEQRLREVISTLASKVLLNTRLSAVTRENGRYRLTLTREPCAIEADKCTGCGRCYEVCLGRAQGAIRPGPSAHNQPFFVIYPELCPCESPTRPCQTACPEGAIDLERPGTELTLEVDGVVLATGYTPFNPKDKVQFNFEAHPNMITALDLEARLRDEGTLVRPADGGPVRRVAFVQCVGSRDLSLKHNFCSRVCCGSALRLGLRLSHAQPGIEVAVFYMDIQNFGKDFDRLLKEAEGRIRLIRSMPGDYFPAPEGGIGVSYFENDQRTVVRETFDVVVLSVGIMPPEENQDLYEMLGVGVNEHGFAAGDPVSKDAPVAVAGTAAGPMDIAESITHAARAAGQLARRLGVLP